MAEPHEERFCARRLESDAGFLLPLLRPGLDVVDVGCGPGSITLGLARRVAPGRVLGIDLDLGRLAMAREAASRAGLDNAGFEAADAASLPLDDAAADLVFANGLVEHLANCLAALREFRRVLKPGGALALRSPDWGAAMVQPPLPALLDSIALRNRWQRSLGGNPEAGRNLKGLMSAAGFIRVSAAAEPDPDSAPKQAAAYMASLLEDPELATLAESEGWAGAEEITAMVRAWRDWSAQPKAFAAFFWCSAVGWKGEQGRDG